MKCEQSPTPPALHQPQTADAAVRRNQPARHRVPTCDQQVAQIAQTQYGLITAAQLAGCGVSPHAIRYRARCGRLFRVYCGVFAVGVPPMSREARWLSAVMSGGAGAALSHLAAASLHGIWRRKIAVRADITCQRAHRRVPLAVTHRSRTLRACDVVRRNGIPVTTVARTLLDLGDVLDAHQLANIMHEAAFRRCLNLRSVRKQLGRARGRRAARVLREALALHESGSAGTRSTLEDQFLDRLLHLHERTRTRSEAPKVNSRIRVRNTSLEVDLLFPQQRLVVEIDGSGHWRKRTRREDARRDRLLREEGFRVLRWKPRDLRRTDAWFLRQLSP